MVDVSNASNSFIEPLTMYQKVQIQMRLKYQGKKRKDSDTQFMNNRKVKQKFIYIFFFR